MMMTRVFVVLVAVVLVVGCADVGPPVVDLGGGAASPTAPEAPVVHPPAVLDGGGPGMRAERAATTQAGVYYTCVMHPQVHQDHPGDCPICGMKLIEKKVGEQKGGGI